jgi:hypothetical protein
MERIERGERLTLRDDIGKYEDGISVGTQRVPSRKIQSLVVRFPAMTGNLDLTANQFFSPEELGEEEPEQ